MRQRLSRESLALLEQNLPPSLAASDLAVWRLLIQGTANCYLLQFDEAHRLLAKAGALANEKHTELLGEVALRRGTLAFWQDNSAEAELAYRKTLEFAREHHDSYLEAAALGSLGAIATKEEHYDESIDMDSKALQVSERIGAQGSVAKILVNMGWSFFEMGDYERALTVFQQAEESSGKAGLISDQAICRTNISAVEYYLRDFPQAQEESQLALQLARNLDEKKLVTETLNILSNVALAKGQIDIAEEYNREAQEISRSVGDHSGELTALLVAGRIYSWKNQHSKAEELLTKIIQDPAIDTATRWEAEARLAKVYDDERAPGKAENEYRRSIETIEAARHSIGQDELRLTFLSSAIEFYDDYIDFLIAHARPNDALKVAELSRGTTLAEGLARTQEGGSASRPPFHPMQLAQRLHATLLFYWLGEKHSYLWVITPTKMQNFQLPPASEIDPLVKSYRQAQAEGRDVFTTSSADGQKLYEMLIAPARKLIPPNSCVIVLPDSSLYSLNFETLIVPDPQPHFWIEDATISTANSLTLLGAAAARPASKEKNLLLVGDPLQASAEFPALRQAPQEISLLENYFPASQRTILVKDKATPAAYLASNPGGYAYIHFVTHGTASRTRPLESAVILSSEGDSYKLYARDIVQHRLNAQLVTISACNGSGTRAYSGEGLVGLSWAFLRAGAHNVIGALWEVSDTATPQLMDKLYSGLAAGQDPATALRNAKLSLLHSDSPYKKPYYWAPFQLYTGS